MSGALDAHVVVRRGAGPDRFVLDAHARVADGEVLALLGPNGAGKSTLLRAVAGLVALDDGAIRVGGEVWDDPVAGVLRAPADRAAGVVFQDYRLFPHLDVLDNVAFGPRARGAGRRTARADARRWLDRLGLAELTGRHPAELSGGQAQRVALARALAAEPRVLLLDEPLAALDARTRLDVRAELAGHLGAFAGSTVLVTHDPLEALVLADRILVLESGRVVQDGTPDAVARRPATEYVARLMGLNLYRGRVTDDGSVALDGGGRLVGAGHDPRTIDDDPADHPGPGDRALVAVPPAAIAVHREVPAGSARNVWTGEVRGLELLTDRVRLDVTGPPGALVDVTASAVAALHLRPGVRVWLSAKATEIVVYRGTA